MNLVLNEKQRKALGRLFVYCLELDGQEISLPTVTSSGIVAVSSAKHRNLTEAALACIRVKLEVKPGTDVLITT